MSDDDEKPLDPAAAAIVAKVRRLMMIASITTFVAVGAVLAVVGYRVFKAGDSAPPAAQVNLPWPKGAKVISSALSDDRLALTIETPDGLEVRLFDLKTLKATGRLRLDSAP